MGVSIIICTFNGAALLPETLAHLAAQVVPAPLRWEVLLVDNGSRDDTQAVAAAARQRHPGLPLRIISEPTPGKIHALLRGVREAAFKYLVVCDDDCRLSPYYVQRAYALMEASPETGILNGYYENRYEGTPPGWFLRHESLFSRTSLGSQRQDITDIPGSIWGAGMVIRKAAYEQLLALGFENLLTGGIGTKRSAGEDTELCLAVRLLGYRIVYDPLLHFVHFMPVRRLQWKTLVAIARANGQASVYYSPYRYHFARRQGHRYPVHTHWRRELLANLTFLLNGRTWLRYFFGKNEGNPAVIRIERQLAKLKALLQLRRHYDESFHRIGKLVADAPLAAPRGT